MNQSTGKNIWAWGRHFALALAVWMAGSLAGAEYNGVEYATDGEIVPGQWNSQYNKAKALSEETDTPLVVFWANPGCAYCRKAEEAMATEEFRAWMEERQYLFVFALGADTKDGADAKNFSRAPSRKFPYVGIYRETGLDNNPKTNPMKLAGRAGMLPVTKGSLAEQIMGSIDKYIGSYEIPFKGGKFNVKESETNRLEIEPGMTSVPVVLTRADKNAEEEATSQLYVILPDGTTNETIEVDWTATSGTSQTITVNLPENAVTNAGQQVTLLLQGQDKQGRTNDVDTTHITCVAVENSAVNPLWIGERTAGSSGPSLKSVSSTGPLAFGEWTMDLDVAKATAAAAAGEAYTLALVEGSLWCPDCKGVFDKFLSVVDAEGNNRFAAWAASNQVALVAIDVPQFADETDAISSPTLLSRTEQNGVSGLGYLTRKGVTDEDAAEMLARNHKLVMDNTAEGGFHRPENLYAYRIGVPTFVILRKDGSVAARLTQFSDMGRKATTDNWDNYIKRFDELLALAASEGDHADDAEVENNDARSTAQTMAANGGTISGELSHADALDVVKLTGTTGAMEQTVKVTADNVSALKIAILQKNASNEVTTVKEVSEVAELSVACAEPGDYYVEVSVSYKKAPFDVAATKAMNFMSYTLSTAVTFKPEETACTGAAAEGSDTVDIDLVVGKVYRLQGIDAERNTAVLEPVTNEVSDLYMALKGGVQVVAVSTTGGEVTYQIWNPGTIGFESAGKTAKESDGRHVIQVLRKEGVSGDVTVKASLNAEKTTYRNSEGEDRFAFTDTELTWAEGEMAAQNIEVTLKDDVRYDGDGEIVLDLTLVSGASVLGTSTYVLKVTENDKKDVGTVGFVAAEPYFAKPMTVYAKASEGTTLQVARSERNDGAVSVTVKPSVATVALSTNEFAWGTHESTPYPVEVSGLVAGKTVKVSLVNPKGGAKLMSGAGVVTIVPVADDAPEFAEKTTKLTFYRSVAAVAELSLKKGTYAPTNKIAVTKLTGALPAGLTAKWDATREAFVVTGVPTKAGEFRVVFQVTETRNRKAVPGLTTELLVTVVDPVVPNVAGVQALNPAVSVKRTFDAIPVLSKGDGLVGTLSLPVVANGKISAKYISRAGTVSFTTKNWTAIDESTGALTAVAEARGGYRLEVVARNDGSVAVTVEDPAYPEEELGSEIAGVTWSKTNPAKDWNGYYTVALKPTGEVEEGTPGAAARGAGYLCLTTKDVNKGTVQYAGVLPNGTAVSGSSTLVRLLDGTIVLPVFKKVGKDVFGALLQIRTEAEAEDAEQPEARVVPSAAVAVAAYQIHDEAVDEGDWAVSFNPYGNVYTGQDLAGCCEEGYETTEPKLSFDVAGLQDWVYVGIPKAFDALTVSVTNTSIKLPKQTNPQAVTFTFTVKTGIVKGTFKLPVEQINGKTTTVAATYQGVVVTGWGEGCSCGDSADVPEPLPFVNGAYWFADKIPYTVMSGTREVVKTLAVKRGGDMSVDK